MISGVLGGLARWAVEIVYSFGYAGVFFVVALANLHLPVPTEVSLPLSGFLVGQGRFSFAPLLAASTTAGLVVALAHYFPGVWIGEERVRRFLRRAERFKLVSESDLDKAHKAFERHGGKAVVIGHLVPGIGALISLPAGLTRMHLGRFVVYTILGSALWNVIFIGLGWTLGRQWRLVERYAPLVEYPILAILTLGLLWFLWRRWRSRARRVRG